MITLIPYLVFNGNCEDAFNFYRSVFGGEILFMGRYKDVPPADQRLFPAAADEKIMHASLQLNPETILMGCDSIETKEQPPQVAPTPFYLYIRTGSHEEAFRIFDELSAGGESTMPITQTFWTTNYGMLVDKFGIHWKIAFDAP